LQERTRSQNRTRRLLKGARGRKRNGDREGKKVDNILRKLLEHPSKSSKTDKKGGNLTGVPRDALRRGRLATRGCCKVQGGVDIHAKSKGKTKSGKASISKGGRMLTGTVKGKNRRVTNNRIKVCHKTTKRLSGKEGRGGAKIEERNSQRGLDRKGRQNSELALLRG